jgi:hypothetical protein
LCCKPERISDNIEENQAEVSVAGCLINITPTHKRIVAEFDLPQAELAKAHHIIRRRRSDQSTRLAEFYCVASWLMLGVSTIGSDIEHIRPFQHAQVDRCSTDSEEDHAPPRSASDVRSAPAHARAH